MCSNLLSLVLVEDNRHEKEDRVAEEPQEASLWKIQGKPHDHLMNCRQVFVWLEVQSVHCVVYLGEAQVEVSLQGAPLSGDDLVEDRGQQESHDHPQSHEEEPRQTLLGVVAVMLTLWFWILLPQQQHSLRESTVSLSTALVLLDQNGREREIYAYLCNDSTNSDSRGRRRLLPLQRSGLRLPASAQSPAHTQTQ